MADYERYPVGRYLVIGAPGEYRVMEQFGSFRMLAKKFKTAQAATKRAQQLSESE